MRILFVTSSAMAGGGPRHLLDWISALKEKGGPTLQIYVAAPKSGVFADPLRDVATDSFDLPERSFSFLTMARLFRFARRHKIDLIHSFGRAGGVYGRMLGLVGYKVLHSPQGLISAGLSQLIYDALEYSLRPLTHLYIFGSSSEAAQGRERFGAKSGLILPPVVAAPSMMRLDPCSEAISKNQPIVVGTIGRFVAHKRVVDLARAVIEMGPEYEVALFGEGDQRPELESLARDHEGRVHVRGLVDRWQALAEIHVFASWSLSESFGLAVAEAMAYGVPCVLSDVPGHRDLAANGARAWLFDPNVPGDFARVVKTVAGDAIERGKRIDAARKFIQDLCGPERVARDLWSLYTLRA